MIYKDLYRSDLVNKLAEYATDNASQSELEQVYLDDCHDHYSGFTDEELVEEFKEFGI
jgi:hypothetical protein